MNDINKGDQNIAGHSLSAEGYASIIRSMPTPAAITNLQGGRFIEVNDAFCLESGYARSELLGHTATELSLLAHPEEGGQILEAVKRRDMYSTEMTFRTKSGETISFLTSICMLDRDEEACQILILRDLREQVELKKKFQETAVKFHNFFGNSRDAIGVARAGIHVYVNPAYLELFGYRSYDELDGRPLFDLIAPDSRDQVSDIVRMRDQGSNLPTLYETRGLRKDGSEFDMEVRSSIYDLEGERYTMGLLRDITDQKAAETALKERLKEMTCLAEVRHAVTTSSSIEELCGQVLESLVPAMQFPEATLAVVELDGRRFTAQRQPGAPRHGIHSDISIHGTLRGQVAVYYLEDREFLIPYEQNLLNGITEELSLWLARDLAEAALHASEEKYRNIVENAQEGIIAYDASWHIKFANARGEAIFGYERGELPGRPIIDIILDEDRAHHKERLKRWEDGLQATYEGCYKKKDGAPVWLQVSGWTIFENGRFDGVNTLVSDITQRKHAEEAVLESEQRFRAAFRTGADAFSIANAADGRLIDVNEQFLKLYGYKKEEIIGKTSLELGMWVNPERRAALVTELASHDRVTDFEVLARRKTGETFNVLYSVSKLRSATGEPFILGVNHDITERKLAEDHLKQLNRELRAISNCNSVLVRTADEKTLIQNICRIICDEAGYLMSWVGYAEHDEAKNVRPTAWAGKVDGYLATANITWADTDRGQGPTGTAIRTGKSVYIQDFENDPSVALWREPALKQGYRSSIALPLVEENEKIIGALTIYSGEINAFTSTERRLLEELASDLAFGINVIRVRVKRKQAEEVVRNRNRMLLTLYNTALQVGAKLRLPQLLASILEEAQSVLVADRGGGVYLYEPDQQLLRLAHGTGINQGRDGITVRIGEGVAGHVFQTAQALIIDDYTRWSGHASILVNEPPSTVMGVPMFVQDKVIGVLTFVANSTLRKFTDQDVQQAEMLAAQVTIAIQNATLFEKLELTNRELAIAYDATIEGWSQAMDLRDKETEGHTQRVTEISVRLAEAFGFDPEEVLYVRWGALLHDIGKMGVPDAVLLKPGQLTDEEWVIMRRHPELAYKMLSPIRYLQQSINIPYSHHEKWDGTGYPRGLKGEEIPLEARIFAVVDVWDVLTSDRPYRSAWSREETLEYIVERAGTHFDPQVVMKFMNMVMET